MAVAPVAVGNGHTGTPVANNDFANFLNATGADSILFFTACPGQTGVFTLTWDQGGTNQSAAALGSPFDANGGTGRVQFYGLVAPTAALKTLRVASAGTPQEIFVGGIAMSGALQTGGTTTFSNRSDNRAAAATPSTRSTVTITSASGDLTVDISSGPEVMTITAAAGTTQIFVDNAGSVTSGGASRKAGSASNTHQWDFANAIQWVASGINVVSAGGGGGPVGVRFPLRRMSMGVGL